MLGQAAIVGLLIYFTSFVIDRTPEIARQVPKFDEIRLIFSGKNGGGGGNHDPLPASHGDIPKASLDTQMVPPTIVLPKEPPKLAIPESVNVAPDVKLPQGGRSATRSPSFRFSRAAPVDPAESGGDAAMASGQEPDPVLVMGRPEFSLRVEVA